MASDREEAKKKARADLRAIIERNRKAFEGEYADEIAALQGLTPDQLDAISPSVSTHETYANLMDVVRLASQRNLSSAELKTRVAALGKTAVKIAKLVPQLAALLK